MVDVGSIHVGKEFAAQGVIDGLATTALDDLQRLFINPELSIGIAVPLLAKPGKL